jgi:hypothetical protein
MNESDVRTRKAIRVHNQAYEDGEKVAEMFAQFSMAFFLKMQDRHISVPEVGFLQDIFKMYYENVLDRERPPWGQEIDPGTT